MNNIIRGDAIDVLPKINNIKLVYIDPPFNTGKTRSHNGISYADKFDDYISYLMDRVKLAYRLLDENGSFFLHADYREIHYIKIEMDKLFGRDNFINEIIWSYDYGGRSKSRWSAKHDNILWYAKDKHNYIYNYDAIDRIPYLAPSLVGAEKAARGKTPTDVWWNTIVGTQSQERKDGGNYPTQKPLNILERIILVHSNIGDTVLDFFAGSGTTGVAAKKHNRKYVLIDKSENAIDIIKKRLE